MKLKLCGLTRMEDIEAANICKPDYIGFVFAESRRRITPEKAARLRRQLDGSIQAAGVFVNTDAEEMARIAEEAGLNVIQLHGEEDMETVKALRQLLPDREIWKAVRFQTVSHIEKGLQTGADRLLIDAWSADSHGGTGRMADWELLASVRPQIPFLLAGGLTLSNIGEAIKTVGPWGVDLSSGIETEGLKDPGKMKKITEYIRKYTEGMDE